MTKAVIRRLKNEVTGLYLLSCMSNLHKIALDFALDRTNPSDFGVNRSKVKVTVYVNRLIYRKTVVINHKTDFLPIFGG